MAFPAEILHSSVELLKNLLPGVQPTVTYYPIISQTGEGKKTYGSPLTLRCLVNRTYRVFTINGQVITVAATLQFLEDVPINGAAGRREPIDPRDKIILPDGFTGPIIDAPGETLDENGKGFTQLVMLGAR